jgi:hypothetical protein
MTIEEIKKFIPIAAKTRDRVIITFDSEQSVYVGKWIRRKSIVVRFFECEDGRYGYKMKSTSVTGFLVSSLPLNHIVSMEYEDLANNREQFKKYVLMNKHSNVWNTLDETMESMVKCRLDRELNRKYLSSICNEYEMKEIAKILSEKRKCTFFIGNSIETFVETDNRENDFCAWLVTPRMVWILINSHVAIFGRRNDD